MNEDPRFESIQIAIQGELGSNSHLAALAFAETTAPARTSILPCASLIDVFEALSGGSADRAVLPIENTLHGSVFEHYDLLLEYAAAIVGERMLRVRHNVIARPGVRLAEVRRVLSHPVALSQCRRWLRAHPEIEAVPAYDTAGSVKRLMVEQWEDAAAIAPELAARQYGAELLVANVEDHAENFTRFYVLERSGAVPWPEDANKMSLAFSLDHRPGSLLGALAGFADAGLNLTRIESRPVLGRPWEYIFFVDVRFQDEDAAAGAVKRVEERCRWLRLLGRYRAAED